jgi:hypothetical protein
MQFTTMYSTLGGIALAALALSFSLSVAAQTGFGVCLTGWEWVRSSPFLVCRGPEPNPSVFPVLQFRGPESVSGRGSASSPVSWVLCVVDLPLPTKSAAYRYLQTASYTLYPINNTVYYTPPGPNDTLGKKCGCNTVIYTLYQACSLCQWPPGPSSKALT